MNNNDLLDEILQMLRTFKDNREQLGKLHHYMLNELYRGGDTVTEAIIVPERYASLVKDVADSLSADLVCYINPATLEKIDIPRSVIDTIMPDEEDVDEEEDDDGEEGLPPFAFHHHGTLLKRGPRMIRVFFHNRLHEKVIPDAEPNSDGESNSCK